MSDCLNYLAIENNQILGDIQCKQLNVSYQLFGQSLGTAPIVVINHALTGNSDVAGEKYGWWKTIVGEDKLIDLKRYTVIAFNIPGNGYDGVIFSKYKQFNARDIAKLFIESLSKLDVRKVHAIIGGSLGGGMAWEMAVLAPELFRYIIPVAADWKSTDWIIGHNHVQNEILSNSTKPIHDARMMAMLFYRTPESFTRKFERTKTIDGVAFNVNSWLNHHGDKLSERFKLEAYQQMNHLLASIDITEGRSTFENVVAPIRGKIIQIAINSDLFFSADENRKTKEKLDQLEKSNELFIIDSIHGHDAFLIEFEQLTKFLTPYL